MVSQRNEAGKWITNFNALHDINNTTRTSNITVDVTQSVTECQGGTRIRLTGTLSDDIMDLQVGNPTKNVDRLLFDTKCGTNVAVVNERRSVQKINLDVALESVVFTNRPLKDEELFQVRLDKKHNKFTYSLGIGVSTYSPNEITVSNHINHLPTPSWAMYHGHFYHNGSLNIKNYGKDLSALVVGDRVGVRRSSTGNLHFHVNGDDQGPAAANLPPLVYGVLELWHNAAMATII
ncbi:neuralized-like protein 4 [Hetaerina americana]|uniref:neuralized-like protein 4 n=1 Tax=Hetaerina americana TaxID=62018 RepID=UPI003A7F5591